MVAKVANSFVSAPLAEKLYSGMDKPLSAEQNINAAKALIESVSDQLAGIPMSFTLSVNNDEASVAVANLAKAAWRELGFTVNVKALDLAKNTVYDKVTAQNIQITDSPVQFIVKNAAYGKRDFDIVAVDWQMYSTDPFVALTAFTSSMNGLGVDFTTGKSRLNISGWWNFD